LPAFDPGETASGERLSLSFIRSTMRNPWIVFLLPFVLFMLVGSLEPTPAVPGGQKIGLAIPYAGYPWVYTAKIAITVTAMLAVMSGYRQFPLRVSWWGLLTGVLGGAVWVGICRLRLEERLLGPLGLGPVLGLGVRSGFNPLEQLRDHAAWAWSFLAIRLLGLVVVAPVVEEFFLRGFVMRLPLGPRWWSVPFGKVNGAALVAGTLLPMLMHPQELFAAAAWFSLVTWLMVRTRNIWDCVAAHAVTNLLLGIYVVASGQWQWM
jgi:hypothetical protein